MAGLLPDDMPPQAVPGGRFSLNFSSWAEGRAPREKTGETPILLPCRAP